ncbi:Hypothetical protein I595_2783 [Croceitalea dokdonensis DOKDO 023]|uniref:Uncharacterized protein n=1 Tax=Croceitalea dokdonensis DOKDO 023 TaxID=1300341 RepID=A0A0N8H3U1_9FLAO|nr:Hypothetical protein I595_2783 [Croceitalea dokdonensis DOKDO 023]
MFDALILVFNGMYALISFSHDTKGQEDKEHRICLTKK